MSRSWRMVPYGMAGILLLITAIAAPSAWATPRPNVVAQTIPTKTPAPPPAPPTEPPARRTAVLPTAVNPTAVTPGSVATPQPTELVATCAGSGSLSIAVDRTAVWPGATVVFTATLMNVGSQPLTQVVLESQLGPGLTPIAVLSGSGIWQGNTLRGTTPSLGPGKRLALVYSARVAPAIAESPLGARAVASSAGCPQKTASVVLGLPPSQLPATGGRLD